MNSPDGFHRPKLYTPGPRQAYAIPPQERPDQSRLTYAAVVDWLAAQGDDRAMCDASDRLLRDARNQRKV